ncbi:putative Enoyl reductase (ER) domain-containing protein [Seiridium unicorne]|uniref:Enoyl reductase (ER) domain-containing protein n=1 Tax=Seiridium unicorne TaxID=138068 RepID=A0ABR2VAP3_9PEZI
MAVPETFKAAVMPEEGAQNVVADRSLAPLEKGEVAIKITATAINPVDWKIRDYKFFLQKFPAVAGSDAAGEIAAVGPEVSGFAEGDRVFFQGIIGKYDSSTFQQYCKMPAALVAKTPENISDEQASGISLASIAVLVAFYDKATGHGLTPPWEEGGREAGKGKAIVILGGSSSVGQYSIQLAKLSGFSKIVTSSSAAHAEYLRGLGADVVLDRSKQSEPADFASAIGDLPLVFVHDAISTKETLMLGVKIVQATKTKHTHVYATQNNVDDEIEKQAAQEPKTSVKPVLGMGSKPELRYLSEPLWKSLGGEEGYVAKGLYQPNRPLVIPGGLAAIETALKKNKDGVSGQKVVIKPFDS